MPEDALILQSIILGAPPLTRDAWMYRASRNLRFRGPAFSPYRTQEETREQAARFRDLPSYRRDTIEPQLGFTTAVLNNSANLRPFTDPLSPCCVFAIKVPAGSRVLFLGGEDGEVLLPFGSGFYILTDPVPENVTYTDRGELVYNQTLASTVLYVSPEQLRSQLDELRDAADKEEVEDADDSEAEEQEASRSTE